MLLRHLWWACLALLALAISPHSRTAADDGGAADPAAPAAPTTTTAPATTDDSIVPERFARWLHEVDPLITQPERAAFLALRRDYHRDAFIRKFWQVRDPYPETGRNELKENWDERVFRPSPSSRASTTIVRACCWCTDPPTPPWRFAAPPVACRSRCGSTNRAKSSTSAS